MEVGGLLRQAREQALLTQRQLAAQLGLPPSTLSRYESGVGQPSLRMLDRILAGCGKQVCATLVQRHADLDADLDRRAAQSHQERLYEIDLLTGCFVQNLSGTVLIGGAWAAALHGLPREHDEGRLWVAGDDESISALAELLHRRGAWIYEDGEPRSLAIRPATFGRHRTARWKLNLVGCFETVVVEPGQPWPVECRLDGDLGALRVVPAEYLGPDDGVRPDVLAHWLSRGT
ncbi:MAG: helix-turn-helix domain-containing protein [Mycobacteriales bacterium]